MRDNDYLLKGDFIMPNQDGNVLVLHAARGVLLSAVLQTPPYRVVLVRIMSVRTLSRSSSGTFLRGLI